MTILFNQNHKDPAVREIFQKKDFRVALSHAINRKEIIDTVFFTQGQPWQAGPRKESPYYHEKLATQFLDFDPAKANGILDNLGLKKGADGIRVRPDGKPLSFAYEISSGTPQWVDAVELIKKYWKAVGIDIGLKQIDRSLWSTRMKAAEVEITNWGGDGGMDAISSPYWYFPFDGVYSFATQWALWWQSGGKQGEQPSALAKKQMDLYDQVRITTDGAKQKDLMKQFLDIAAEEFWVVGICTVPEGYGIVKNNFKNVPKKMFSSGGDYMNPGVTMPEQYFFAK